MKPDPWSVVEFHARAAARNESDGQMTAEQRLALYAAAAPEVIGAIRLSAMDGAEWWSAPVTGTVTTLVWNNRGEYFLASPSSALVRQWVVGVGAGLLVFVTLSPATRLWGMIPAVLLGIGTTIVAQRQWPAWTRFGNVLDPAGAQRALTEFVARYERDVPVIASGDPP